MKALIFYALLEKFFIELNQLIPLPNWSIFVVSTSHFLAITVIIITIVYHILVLNSILGYMTLLQGHYFGKIDMFLVLWKKVMRFDKKAAKTLWDNRVHPKYKQDSACLNIIFVTTLCLAVLLNLIFSKFSCIMSYLSLFYEWSTPTVELPATVVVALHHGKRLV